MTEIIEKSLAEAVLKEAKAKYGYEPFAKAFDYNRAKKLTPFFAEQSAETKLALNDWVMAHSEGKTFGELHRALRVVNGFSKAKLIEKFQVCGVDFLGFNLSQCENMILPPRFTESYQTPFLKYNLFKLSDAQLGQLSVIAEHENYMCKIKRNEKVFGKTFATQEALFTDISRQIKAYLTEDLLLEDVDAQKGLITRNQAILHLIPFHPIIKSKIAKENGFNDILKEEIISDAKLKIFAKACDIAEDSNKMQLLLALPYQCHDCAKYFTESVRHEMVKPGVKHIFEFPDIYNSPGDWLKALRVAAQVTREDIAERLNVSHQYISQLESNLLKPTAKITDAILRDNLYSLPENAKGEIDPVARQQFLRLLENPDRLAWHERTKLFHRFQPMDEALHAFEPQMVEQIKSSIVEELSGLSQTHHDGSVESGRMQIIIEGRSVHLLEAAGQTYLDRAEWDKLAEDKSFMRRLALAAEPEKAIAQSR